MIQVTVGTTSKKVQVVVNPDDTILSAVEKADVNLTGAIVHLNGMLVSGEDLQSTFAQMNVADGSKALVSVIIKASSASC